MTNRSNDQKGMDRRSFLKASATAAATLPLFSISTRPAFAAEFNYKFATGQDPTHPVNVRAQEALNRIREATNGRLDIKLFPANQLGSDHRNGQALRGAEVPQPDRPCLGWLLDTGQPPRLGTPSG